MYTVPDFNQLCEIYTLLPTYDFTTKVSRGVVECQLRGYGRLTRQTSLNFFNNRLIEMGFGLLVPAGTDLRDECTDPGVADCVEVPADSGRFYLVDGVDDVAKGFPNEYRLGILVKVAGPGLMPTFPLWPSPIP